MSKSKINIDMSQITRREFNDWRRDRKEIEPGEVDRFDFEQLYQRVIVAWEHGPISYDTYLDLPMPDSMAVDTAVSEAISALSEKK